MLLSGAIICDAFYIEMVCSWLPPVPRCLGRIRALSVYHQSVLQKSFYNILLVRPTHANSTIAMRALLVLGKIATINDDRAMSTAREQMSHAESKVREAATHAYCNLVPVLVLGGSAQWGLTAQVVQRIARGQGVESHAFAIEGCPDQWQFEFFPHGLIGMPLGRCALFLKSSEVLHPQSRFTCTLAVNDTRRVLRASSSADTYCGFKDFAALPSGNLWITVFGFAMGTDTPPKK
jgi:hypothetical protein